MRYFLISNNIDTLTGFRLAGIEGVVVHTHEEVREALDDAIANKEIGVLLIAERLALLCPEIIYRLKAELHSPLLVEIPDRHGSNREEDSITKYVRDAIGIKI